MWLKTKEFIKFNEGKIIMVAGFIIVAALSFEGGMLKGQTMKQNPVVVKAAENQAVCGASVQKTPEAQNIAPGAPNTTTNSTTPDNPAVQITLSGKQDCAYVGSKNSNKYYPPTCQWAKRIKSENLVCFKDENEAKSRGYLPTSSCK